MRRLEARIYALRDEGHEYARAQCKLADHLLRHLTPKFLDEYQFNLRQSLLAAEDDIREWADHSRPRPQYLKRFRKRYGPSIAIGTHAELADMLGRQLERNRQVLRQAGDVAAWIALRQEPRVIAPLYAERTHHLAGGRGLVAPMQLMHEAHNTGQFLVIDNDLTRCLGDGDLTVVRAGKPWALPMTYEVKSPGNEEPREGLQIIINCIGAVSNHPDQAALHQEFTSAIGFSQGNIGPSAQRLQRQTEGMERRARVLYNVNRPRQQLNRRDSYWPVIETVIRKAQQQGSSYDEAEPGLLYSAVRVRIGEDTFRLIEQLGRRLQEHVPRGEPVLTSVEFQDQDEFSAVMPPIALWPLPPDQRALLLGGGVQLGCIFRRDIFDRAFEDVGLALVREGGGWTIRKGEDPALRFDALEAAKLRLGIAYNALSPREAATVCAEEVDRDPTAADRS